MIFASIYKGEYLIIKDDVVIGRVYRFKKRYHRNPEWHRDFYLLEWVDKDRPVEKYTTLPAIQAVHTFENFPGYGRVLHKPGTIRYASKEEKEFLTAYEQRYRGRYINRL